MNKLTVAAAALAAGLVTLVAQAQAESDRSMLGSTISAGAKPAKPAGEAKAEAGDTQAENLATNAKRASLRVKRKGGAKINPRHPGVDGQTTASIAPRVRPELRAVARKTVKGLVDIRPETKVAAAAGYTTIVARYASSYGVPASLAHAVISVESSYSPNKRGGAGEIGLMQIKPATARMMGYAGSASGLFDPETNIRFGMKYLALAHQLAGGETCGTILRYNAGHGARRMNPVSAAYCMKVKRLLGG